MCRQLSTTLRVEALIPVDRQDKLQDITVELDLQKSVVHEIDGITIYLIMDNNIIVYRGTTYLENTTQT